MIVRYPSKQSSGVNGPFTSYLLRKAVESRIILVLDR